MGRGIEYKGQKGSNRRSGSHTHDQPREAWNTAESCDVTESDSSSTDRPTVTVRVFGLMLGKAHSVLTGQDLRATYISMYFVL